MALLHLDGDTYTSTIDVLDALYHKVSPGGHIVVDDYYSWYGCHEAVNDFRRDHYVRAPLIRIDWTGAAWVKEV